MTILEGNKLIAEFMGAKDVGNGWINIPSRGRGYQKKWYPRNLKYNYSWDWIMPVVEKIDKLFDEKLEDEWFSKFLDDDFPNIQNLRVTESIKSVYNSIIQFIEWYNKQPNP